MRKEEQPKRLLSVSIKSGVAALSGEGFTKDIARLALESSGERPDHLVDTAGEGGVIR
jgi:hypothetical protein